jgi:tRNA nucleotidyltransferase/poly(A) polymerase
MASDPLDAAPLQLDGISGGAGAVVDSLAEAGHEAVLVGGCVRDLLQGRTPDDFDVATSAPAEASLGLFPRAIPIGLQHGTIMIPTDDGPVDVTCFRGASLAEDLAHRDFTVNAIAYDPRTRRLVDPHDGRADLAKGRLRAVGSAAARFAEDPLRAVRAARLQATLGLEVDPEVESAMNTVIEPLRAVARERVRVELSRLMVGPGAGTALALLRRSGIEADLAPGVAEDAARVVPRLPPRLDLRLAGWLRGARSTRILRRLRFPRRTTEQVERLLRGHPVEAGVDPTQEASLRRQLKRVGLAQVEGLVALRRAELECGSPQDGVDPVEAAALLDRFAAAVERLQQASSLALQRQDLALDGAAVMEILGVPPGPAVGRALRRLTDRILDDPSLNTPSGLRALLESWANDDGGRKV